ncbi:class I SAM-dependent methyltransferase [Corallincola holothuriorum]|uniref:Class I SAM-dependent methyltransferase n=1 Tax=Corallincola holothuriorum TaxID=2282215 RepID=A0A368NIQ5_9GAMM|nr:class I SAM-dependent methyltransferase [Corallincola holothuriorum]RCU49534.1 class I SAM-dependent methyltransferase [Corallincola holothuriorum]
MDYIALNKAAWDKRTEVHVDSKFYDVEGFLKGNSSLNPIELAHVGNVSNKSLLHLQCHFGLDTLSWARMGAEVTGVDLSSVAISQARSLASKLALNAHFINQDIYLFGDTNQQQFDIVFTSYGALCWLPDLDRWAETVAKALKDNGELHLIEFHPCIDLYSGYSYFPKQQPDVEEEGTYTENCSGEKSPTAVWAHSLGELFTALVKAGIKVEEFEESPFSPYNCLPDLQYVEDKGYQLLFKEQQVPLVYRIKGIKQS